MHGLGVGAKYAVVISTIIFNGTEPWWHYVTRNVRCTRVLTAMVAGRLVAATGVVQLISSRVIPLSFWA